MRAAKSCSDATEHDPIERRLALRLLAGTEARHRYLSRLGDSVPIAELLGQPPRGKRLKENEWRGWLDAALDAEERQPLERADVLFRNIERLSERIPLGPIEQEVLAFWALYCTREALSELIDSCFGTLTDLRLARLVAVAWGRERDAVEAVIRPQSRLFASGVVRLEPHPHLLAHKIQALPGLLDALYGRHNSTDGLIGFAVKRAPESLLTCDDYPHLADESVF